jgi:Protein of unknown function (DUF4058)
MSSPFPGMDPYLEQPAFWSSFHSKFVVALADAIEVQLDAAYYVEVETRTYLDVGVPQEIRERYLEIREVESGKVITAIELLLLKHKRAGDGRKSDESKRALILGSLTHLIELDLLRAGQALPIANVQMLSDYQILLSRSDQRPQADLYSFSIRDAFPTIPIPLQASELAIDLQTVFNGVYQRSRYHSRIDYQQPIPPPKLKEADQAWVDRQLAQWSKP